VPTPPDTRRSSASPGRPAGGLAFQAGAGYLLGRVGAIAYQSWGEVLARLDLTPTQAKVLMALGQVGPLGQQRLAALIGVDPRNAVQVVEALVEARLISRKVDASDRRRRVLGLTASGQRITHELTLATARNDDELLASLSSKERAKLRALLHAVLDASKEGE
jgi:DNA-binding MarR family transcriptional regulator